MSEQVKHSIKQTEAVKPLAKVSKLGTSDEIAGVEAQRTISDAELLRTGAHYEINEQTREKKLITTSEQIQKIHETVETILAEGILTKEALQSGDIEIHFEEPPIGYEFEVEKEQRIMVDVADFQISKWVNHIVDTYDQSGRCRIRMKNGDPRLSLKVPLLSQDTEKAKCCIRLEFKPRTEQHKEELLKIRELISAESGTEIHEKWGTPIKLSNGDDVWINKDDRGNHWIETDESYDVKELLPEGITYLSHQKSKINVGRQGSFPSHRFENDPAFQNFQQHFIVNMGTLSRSAKGISDTSVSRDKEKLDLEGEKLAGQVKENIQGLATYIWENRTKPFENPEDTRKLIHDIANIANNALSKKKAPDAFRTHEVPYGRKIPPGEITKEMGIFYADLLKKIKEADAGNLDPKNLSQWVELEINQSIHPYADGCGKIAVGLSSFLLTRYNHVLPNYHNRNAYYDAMNGGAERFGAYYQTVFGNTQK